MTKNALLELFPIGDPLGRMYPLLDPISAVTGGIGLVGNVVGGIINHGAAGKAAAIQQKAAQAGSDKIGVAIGDANGKIADATTQAQGFATEGGNRVLDTAGAAKATNDEATKNANALLDPYRQAGEQATGTLQAGLAAGGDFNKTPTLADLQIDPGYDFRLQQGQLAMARSQAARGGALGGQAQKDLAGYSQGLASQEYQNAFNRFETSTQNRFANLSDVSRQGQVASTNEGNNLTGAARYGGDITTDAAKTALGADEFAGNAGMSGASQISSNTLGGAEKQADILTGGANAAAAGVVGQANALTGAISGGANAIGGALTNYNLLRNPALLGKVNVTVGGAH